MELLAAEKHQVEALKNMQHQNKSLSMLDEILEDVRKAADRLEEEIEEHAFDDNKSVSKTPEWSLHWLSHCEHGPWHAQDTHACVLVKLRMGISQSTSVPC